MIKNIRMFDVGAADCFVLSSNIVGNCSHMLVDCGSQNKYKYVRPITTPIGNGQFNSFLLTHFHDDHYNNIHSLAVGSVINNVYLPDFFSVKGLIALQFATLKLFSIKSKEYSFAFNLLNAVPNLVSKMAVNCKINFVKYKDSFTVPNLGSFGVLWPDMKKIGASIIGIIENGVLQNFLKQEDEYRKILDLYFGEEREATSSLTLSDNIYRDIGGLKHRVDNLVRDIDEFSNNYILRAYEEMELLNAIFKFQNDISLVFHSIYATGEDDKDSVLFLGDVTKSNFEKYIRGRCYEGYRVIKIAHHATSPYFTSMLPNAEIFLIPSGTKKNQPIDCRYHCHYKAVQKYYVSNANWNSSCAFGSKKVDEIQPVAFIDIK